MKKRILSFGALAIAAALVSSVVAQTVTGKPEDNKLTPATGTFYVNVPPDPIPPNNLNNSNTESLGVAIASNGNMIIGWEDDGDALTDFEAVWTLYDRNGTSISPNVDITSIDPAYAGQTINSKFMSYFRADKSPIAGRTGWGPKIKANLFGPGIGMGSSDWDLGKEVSAMVPWTDANEDDYPAVQLLTDEGQPLAIVTGVSATYAQGAGAVRIADWEYLSNGNIVIVGESRQNDDLVNLFGGTAPGKHMIYRIVSPTGTEVKAAALLSETPETGEMWHGVGVTANGFGARFSLGGKTIVRLFKNDGTPITTNIDVGALTGKLVPAQGGRGDGVGFHGNGTDAYVISASGLDENGTNQVWVTVLNTNGTVRYSKAATEDVKLNKVGGLDAAINEAGRVFVVYSTTIVDDPAPALVMGRMLDATGKPIGGTFYLSEKDTETIAATGDATSPRVAARGDGFAVVWVSNNSDTAPGTKVVAGRLFGVAFEPGSIESVGLKRIVADTPVIVSTHDNGSSWEPYTSVLGNSTFLVEANAYAVDDVNMRFVVAFQPTAGGTMKLGEGFFSDDGKPYRAQINLSRQTGNPGRVAGDKRPGATNFVVGGECSLYGFPEFFNSDGRFDPAKAFYTALAAASTGGRDSCLQLYSLDPSSLAQTMRSKALDSAFGRCCADTTPSNPASADQISRWGGELAALDNGNFVAVVEDRSGIFNPDGDRYAVVATIFAPDGSVVKEAFKVSNSDIWSNVAAYRGGFAVRAKNAAGSNRAIYFYDNAGNLKGQIEQTVTGQAYDTGRGDGTRIASHINSPYVFLVGSTGSPQHSVPLAVFDSRDFSYVTLFQVTEVGFDATADRVGLAVDALNRVTVAWTSKPSGFVNNQVAARVLAFDATTKSINPLTHSFWAFINNNASNNITSYQMNPSMTTKQICIAAKGRINLQNQPELDANTPVDTAFYTVISHPNPQDDPTIPVGGQGPTLTVTRVSATSLTIAWPAAATGFTLESKNSLSDPSWTTVGTANPTEITIGTGNKFYRLRK